MIRASKTASEKGISTITAKAARKRRYHCDRHIRQRSALIVRKRSLFFLPVGKLLRQ
jgi:hypothetical protein